MVSMPLSSSIDTTAWAVVRVWVIPLVYTSARGADNRREPSFLGISIGQRLGRRAPPRCRRQIGIFRLQILALERLLGELGQALDDIRRKLRGAGQRRP